MLDPWHDALIHKAAGGCWYAQKYDPWRNPFLVRLLVAANGCIFTLTCSGCRRQGDIWLMLLGASQHLQKPVGNNLP